MSELYPNTPQMQPDAPQQAPPAADGNPYPNTPQMAPPKSGPVAADPVPAAAAKPSGPDARPDPIALAAQYPFELPPDFDQHDEPLTAFRALAARHRIPPAVAQELLTFHAAELRRLAVLGG